MFYSFFKVSSPHNPVLADTSPSSIALEPKNITSIKNISLAKIMVIKRYQLFRKNTKLSDSQKNNMLGSPARGNSLGTALIKSVATKKSLEKLTQSPKSDIPCGVHTLSVIHTIYQRNKNLSLPLPQTIVFNLGFKDPVVVSSGKALKFAVLDEIFDIKKCISNLGQVINSQKKFDLPLFIIKSKNSLDLKFSTEEVLENFPDMSADCVIQRFVQPKGLKAIKYRVILNNFKKVLIFSNKYRTDCKIDGARRQSMKIQKKDSEINTTLVLHKTLSKFIRENKEIDETADLRHFSQEKLSIFKMFENKKSEKLTTTTHHTHLNPLTRFLTHQDTKKTDIYEGTLQSFAEIIKLTEYLREQIDFYYLDDSKINEIAVDFLQDCLGGWQMLKIKYAKIEKKSPERKKSRLKISSLEQRMVLNTLVGLKIVSND